MRGTRVYDNTANLLVVEPFWRSTLLVYSYNNYALNASFSRNLLINIGQAWLRPIYWKRSATKYQRNATQCRQIPTKREGLIAVVDVLAGDSHQRKFARFTQLDRVVAVFW